MVAMDDYFKNFDFILSEPFLYDFIEWIHFSYYIDLSSLDIEFIMLSAKRNFIEIICQIFKNSGKSLNEKLLRDILLNIGSIIAQYSKIKEDHYNNPIDESIFSSILDESFVVKFYNLNRGYISYYHDGKYKCQISKKKI